MTEKQKVDFVARMKAAKAKKSGKVSVDAKIQKVKIWNIRGRR